MSTGRIAGRVALVVGGAGGIGAAAARVFAEAGASVMVADLNGPGAQHVAESIRAVGGVACHAGVDVLEERSVEALVRETVRTYGKLDILFNTVGGSLPDDGPLTEADLSVWDRLAALDVRGTLACARHSIAAMVASGGGSVVLMSSGAALVGAPRAPMYAAAKGAVNALTRSLAATYARSGIRVNAICAGRVETDRVRRAYGSLATGGSPGDLFDAQGLAEKYPFWIGQPEDIARIALFLASDESRMITGAEIPANGGRSAY